MSRVQKQKRRGARTVGVVMLLLVSAAFAARSAGLFGSDGGPASPGAAGEDMEDAEADFGFEQQAAPALGDLLEPFGVHAGAGPVPLVFERLDVVEPPAPAPLGEVGRAADQRPGEDPPELGLRVIMVSELSRRAVFDGVVVGVGDEVAGGVVEAIVPGAVALRHGGRTFTYEVGNPTPREFRAEKARRIAERARLEGAGEGVDGVDVEAGSEDLK